LALIDTAKEEYFDEYIKLLEDNYDISKIKYLIVNHTEPDHSGEIHKILEKYPNITIVGTPCAISFLKDISNKEFSYIEVKEGFELKVGDKTLNFIIAPNLHWPDSMFTYLKEEKILFTCDVFGAHYCSDYIFDSDINNENDWNNYQKAFYEYYEAIFSPFKPYVNSGLKKIENLELNLICPSHGILISKEGVLRVKNEYSKWSKQVPTNKNKITICYVSAYGYTGVMAKELERSLKFSGFEVSMFDLVYDDLELAIHSIRESGAFLVGSPTLNSDTLPQIWNLLTSLSSYDCVSKIAGAFGAFGWSGEAIKNIESRLSALKCEVFRPGLRIRFNPKYSVQKLEKIEFFAKSFAEKVKIANKREKEEWVEFKTGKWKCLICGEIFEGEMPPKSCPVCGAPSDQFIQVEEEEVNFLSENLERIVIVGGGIAAISAAESIRKRNLKAVVEIYSNENYFPYLRILLSKRLSFLNNSIDYIHEKEWFERNNISFFPNMEVQKVFPNEKKIVFSDSKEVYFDKLLIATGASAFKPPIYGNDKRGVFNLRTRKDFDNIREFVNRDEVKKIIIVGGGILGVEIAASLKEFGKEIEIIETGPRLMLRQLDEDGSKILENLLLENGIKFRTSEIVEEIYGTGNDLMDVCGVKLSHSAEKVGCEAVIFSAGIKSNIEFLKDSGINYHRGVIVDEYMRTNFDFIYAAGDVVEFKGKNIGLWSIAKKQGEIAGANIVGDNKKYCDDIIACSFNAFNYSIFSVGDLGYNYENKNNYQLLELNDPSNKIHKKFYFYNGVFVGGVLMGDTSKAVSLRKAIYKGSNIQNFLDDHFLDETL
jgi:flavorubredoxin/NADPH-dependent 2,4-dienoyl-CoA reductase/sulfur reductase-like enzyme